jgi:Phage integrase, N-terminal SAM-like domain
MKVSLSIAGKAFPAISKEIVPMSELRERMIADMRSQGLSAATQEVYLQGVKGLAAYYRRPPDQLDEKEVRGYLLHLRDERGVARGTYMPHQGGIRFLFAHTLDREWPLFLKKESARPRRSACLTFCRMRKREPSFPA